jgi:hypothetical protein
MKDEEIEKAKILLDDYADEYIEKYKADLKEISVQSSSFSEIVNDRIIATCNSYLHALNDEINSITDDLSIRQTLHVHLKGKYNEFHTLRDEHTPRQ